MPKLDNPKHEMIAQRLAAGDTQGKALIAAGYAVKSAGQNAVRLLKQNPEIRQRCEELRAAQRAIEERFQATREGKKELNRAYVRATLQEIVERCMVAEPVVIKGVPTGEYVFDAAGATRAAELIGKDLGMFVERKEIGLPGSFATVEERKAAEQRVKAKMVKLGMARVVGHGSIAEQPLSAVEVPTTRLVSGETGVVSAGVEDSTQKGEIQAPETEADPDDLPDQAEADGAVIPPGILQADPDQPDPASVERMRPARANPKPIDPGPGPERAAYRKELRRRQGLDARWGTPTPNSQRGEGS